VATHIAVEPIEGPEESRLTYVGVQDLFQEDPQLQNRDAAIVEVGGGSTEAIFLKAGRVMHSGSYRLGSLRMREVLETDRAPAERVRSILDQQIRRSVEQIHRAVPLKRVPFLVTLSGDVRFAASILAPAWEQERLYRIPVRDFAALADRLVAIPVDELVRQYRIPYQEAETVGPALLAYEHLAAAFQVEEIVVTGASLRDGLLKEMALGGAWTAEFVEQTVASAMQLAARCNVDEDHALRVAELAVRLFHELQPEHNLDERCALLLRLAGLLHETGRFINETSHHKHSYYIIANSDLFGLSRQDLTLIGLVARYHRRAMPRAYHTEYTTLDHHARLVVSQLAALLRVADALDRQRVRPLPRPTFTRAGNQFLVTINEAADLTLERIALKQKANMFEQLFGLQLVLRSASSPDEVIRHD
jgi:exopolyphosphatase/guanosine-5'-triphosphate,3'-diphosphate pyrophosphatase